MELIGEALVAAARLILSGDRELVRIASLSLVVSATAAFLATLVGVPVGIVLHLRKFRGDALATIAVNTGMGLPPVVVGLVVTILLWRSGPLGRLGLLFTPQAMVVAQFIVAVPIVAGFTRGALELLAPEVKDALRVDGASDYRVGWELVGAARGQVLVAIAAGFGRAISEVGASIMVGGNLIGQTRILTTAIALETNKGEFALAMALGFILLLLAFMVNTALGWSARAASSTNA